MEQFKGKLSSVEKGLTGRLREGAGIFKSLFGSPDSVAGHTGVGVHGGAGSGAVVVDGGQDCQKMLKSTWAAYLGGGKPEQFSWVLASLNNLVNEARRNMEAKGGAAGNYKEVRYRVSEVLGTGSDKFCADCVRMAVREAENLLRMVGSREHDVFSQAGELGQNGGPSLLQLLRGLSQVVWEQSAIRSFSHNGMLSIVLRVLNEHMHVLAASESGTSASSGSVEECEGEQQSTAVEAELALWNVAARLCEHRDLVDELTDVQRGDEALSVLFDMAAFETHKSPRLTSMRSAALGTLRCVATGCGQKVAVYMNAYACLRKLVSRVVAKYETDWEVGEAVQVAGLIVSLVYMLTPFSPKTLDEFAGANGYELLEGMLLWVQARQCAIVSDADGDKEREERDKGKNVLQEMVRCLVVLVFVGGKGAEEKEKTTLGTQRTWVLARAASTSLPIGSSQQAGVGLKGVTSSRACNRRAFDALLNALGKCSSEHEASGLILLAAISDILTGHKDNYSVLLGGEAGRAGAQQQGVAGVFARVHNNGPILIDKALDLVRYLVINLGVRPIEELCSFRTMFQARPDLDIQISLCGALLDIVAADYQYKDILRELGVLEAVLNNVCLCDSDGQAPDAHVAVLLETIQEIVVGSVANAGVVRRGGHACFLRLVWDDTLHQKVLDMMCEIVRTGMDEDAEACIVGLCEVAQSYHMCAGHRMPLTRDVLWALVAMVESRASSRAIFRMYGGFDIVYAILCGMCAFRKEKDAAALRGQPAIEGKVSGGARAQTDADTCESGSLEKAGRGAERRSPTTSQSVQEIIERVTSVGKGEQPCEEDIARVTCAAIALLSVATYENRENADHLWGGVGVEGLRRALSDTGLLRTKHAHDIVEHILGMACGLRSIPLTPTAQAFKTSGLPTDAEATVDAAVGGEAGVVATVGAAGSDDGRQLSEPLQHRRTLHARTHSRELHASLLQTQEGSDMRRRGSGQEFISDLVGRTWLGAPLMLLVLLCSDVHSNLSDVILSLVADIAQSSPEHTQSLCDSGAMSALIDMLRTCTHALAPAILRLLATVGSLRLSPVETRALLALCERGGPERRRVLYPAMARMAQGWDGLGVGVSMCYVRFSHAVAGHACADLPVFERVWPPSAGFTFACWVYVEGFSGVLRLFQLNARGKGANRDGMHTTSIMINRSGERCLSVQTGSSEVLQFSAFRFEEGAWYHVAVVHTLNKIQANVAALYVDGSLREQRELKSGLSLKDAVLNQVQTMVSQSAAEMSGCFGSRQEADPKSALSWRLKGVFLIEEPLSAEVVSCMHRAGVSYNGYCQGEVPEGDSKPDLRAAHLYAAVDTAEETEFASHTQWVPRVAPEKIIFASRFRDPASSPCTLTNTGEIKRCKGLVENMSSGGAAAASVGALKGGACVVCTHSLCHSIQSVGGLSAILALIEKADTQQELLNLLTLLRRILWANLPNLHHMGILHGYKVLGRILQMKSNLFTGGVVRELLRMAGLGNVPNLAIVASPEACKYLVADFRLWRGAPSELLCEAYAGLRTFLKHNIRRSTNTSQMQRSYLAPFLTLHLCQQHLTEQGVEHVTDLFEAFITDSPRTSDLQEAADLVIVACDVLLAHAKRRSRKNNPNASSVAPKGGMTSPLPSPDVELEPVHPDLLLNALLKMLLGVSAAYDDKGLDLIRAVLEPGWFLVLLDSMQSDDNALETLIRIIALLLPGSKDYTDKARGAGLFIVLREILINHHTQTRLYTALYHLLFPSIAQRQDANNITQKRASRDNIPQDDPYEMQQLSDTFLQRRGCKELVADVLPILFGMLRANVRFEHTLQQRTDNANNNNNNHASQPATPGSTSSSVHCRPHMSSSLPGTQADRERRAGGGEEDHEGGGADAGGDDAHVVVADIVEMCVDRVCGSEVPSSCCALADGDRGAAGAGDAEISGQNDGSMLSPPCNVRQSSDNFGRASSTTSSDGAVVTTPRPFLRTASVTKKLACAREAMYESGQITAMNCTTVRFVLSMLEKERGFRAYMCSADAAECMVGLVFLEDDLGTNLEAHESDDGTLQKVTGHVIRKLGHLFGTMGMSDKIMGSSDKVVGSSPVVDKTGGPGRDATSPEPVQGTPQREPRVPNISEEEDEWDACDDEDDDYAHVARGDEGAVMVSRSNVVSMHGVSESATGRVVLELISRVVEECVRTQQKGTAVLHVVLQSVPFCADEGEERAFGGMLMSSLCKYLCIGSAEFDLSLSAELRVNLEALCELCVDAICSERYPIAHVHLIELIATVTQKALRNVFDTDDAARAVAGLHRASNRLVLHLLTRLSKSSDTLKVFVSALEDQCHVLFGPHNSQDAVVLQLVGQSLLENCFFHSDPAIRDGGMRVFAHLLMTKRAAMNPLLTYQDSSGGGQKSLFTDGFDKLLVASGGVLRVGKDTSSFVQWLNSADGRMCRDVMEENAGKHKRQFLLNSERRLAQETAQHHKQRLARLKKRNARMSEDQMRVGTVLSGARAAQTKARDRWAGVQRRRLQNLESVSVYTGELWARERADLFRECGVFGGDMPVTSWKTLVDEGGGHTGAAEGGESEERAASGGRKRRLWWRLDFTEGPQRMRRRLEVDVGEMANPRYNQGTAGMFLPVRACFLTSKGSRGKNGAWETREDLLEPQAMSARLPQDGRKPTNRPRAGGLGDFGDFITHITDRLGLDSHADEESHVGEIDTDRFLWLLEPSDDIVAVYNTARLYSGSVTRGVCVVCTHHTYIFEHSFVQADGSVCMFNDALNNGSVNNGSVEGQQTVCRLAHTEVRDVQKRNYLLRPVGLEFFMSDGLNYLLIFHKSEREAVLETMTHMRQEALARVEASTPEDSSKKDSSKTAAAHAVMGEADLDLTDAQQTSELAAGRWTGRQTQERLLKNVSRRWQVGDISNLQYLMHLNTLAGRSYNDLTQYPIFPWVVRDYTSPVLDLNRSDTFRDLTKPMGAQDEARADVYKKRFENWLEPDPEHATPRFHYATHYSSAAAVIYFMVRLEPFTVAHVQLQGGKFDHADRLFSSLAEAWESASKVSMSDVKELTPEFYYMPDFLVNINALDLGMRQSRQTQVRDVDLPPWACGSPDECVRLLRKALECEYVSQNLHNWIDLIFGYKQKGTEAEKALNVFHALTYEGSVDVDAIQDPVEKLSTIAQILNFGQTPTQLFQKPHPKRDPGVVPLPPTICTDPNALESSTIKEPSKDGLTRDVRQQSDGKVVFLNGKACFCLPNTGEVLRWGNGDGSLRHYVKTREGFLDALQKQAREELVAVYEGLHVGGVTCAAVSDDGSILVTGGAEGDVCLWRMEAHSFVVSGAGEKGRGSVILWDANRPRFIRELISDLPGAPASVCTSENGSSVVACAGRELRIITINGVPLAQVDMEAEADSFTVAAPVRVPDWCVEYPIVVSGHADGCVRFWRLIPHRSPKVKKQGQGWRARIGKDQPLTLELLSQCDRSHKGAVTCITFTTDNPPVMHTGDASGMVVQWGKLQRKFFQKEAAWKEEGTDISQLPPSILQSVAVTHMRTERDDEALGTSTSYVYECCLDKPDGKGKVCWLMKRTYAQFAELQGELQRRGGCDALLPPRKTHLGQLSDKARSEREEGLTAFLRACLQQCTVRQAGTLQAFICATDEAAMLGGASDLGDESFHSVKSHSYDASVASKHRDSMSSTVTE